jgi:hypothetical protein
VGINPNHPVMRATAGGLHQVGLAQKVRHKCGAGRFVEFGRAAQLLDPAVIHDRNRVGHRHGLFLIVRDMHESQTHLGLDSLELNLHLPPQFKIQRAQWLI